MKPSIQNGLRLALLASALAIAIWLWQSGFDWQCLTRQDSQGTRLTFFLMVVFLPLIGAPISAFYLFAGLNFPPFTALFLTASGLVLNMSLGYAIGRLLPRAPLLAMLSKRKLSGFLENPRHLIRLTILLRAVPGVPYWLQNYLLGLARVPFSTYLLLSWSIQCFFCAATILLTHTGKNLHHPANALLFALLALLLTAVILYSRKGLRQQIASGIDS
jgi:uncharacterized membrane protein YdjX (TVP38/TMEM64 family)